MKDLSFRAATIADLPILLAFEQGIIQTERPFNKTLKPGPISYYDIEAMIIAADTEMIVAVLGEEIIGSAYMTIKAAKPYKKHAFFAYLGFMYVKPTYRGKGINGQIIVELKRLAKAKGIGEMRLDVYHDNQPAVRAYNKAGFTRHLVDMRMEI